MDLLLEHLGKGFVTMLIISMPAVLTAAAIGLVVGILQAVTQVQEQTIAAAPKVLGVFLVIMMMGGFSTTNLIEYFRTSVNIAFNVIPHDEETILSRDELYQMKAQFLEDQYYGEEKPGVEKSMKNPGKVPYSNNKFKEMRMKPPQSAASQPNFIENQKINSGSN